MSQYPRQQRAVDPQTGRLFRIVKSPVRFAPPPPALQKATLDNLALVPGSLLPYKAEYQAIANQAPPGTTLVVLPPGDSHQRRTFERVVSGLQAQGRRVQILSSSVIANMH